MGDVDWLVSLVSYHHLHFPSSHPPDELGNNVFPHTEWDSVRYVAEVGLKARGNVDSPQSSLEVGDFQVVGGDLILQLLFVGLGLIEFLAGGQGVVVYGGDESKGNCVDGVVDIGVCVEEYFRHARGDWGEFLLSFLVGDEEVKGWGFVFVSDDSVWGLGGGCFSKGGESLFDGNESWKLIVLA